MHALPEPRANQTHRSIKCAHTHTRTSMSAVAVAAAAAAVEVMVVVVVELVRRCVLVRGRHRRPSAGCNKLRLNSYGFVHVRWRMRIGVI